MSFAGKVWKILVGIKDGLVLLFMLLFFIGLFAILSSRPNPGQVRDGALLIDLAGVVVEEKSAVDPIAALISGSAPVAEYRARDIVRALDAAATDTRIKAVVIDLTTFLGGVFYSVDRLGSPWEGISHANPLFYVVDAIRYGFLGTSDVGAPISFAILAAMSLALLAWSQYLFTSGRKLKP